MDEIIEPNTFEEAATDSKWVEAIKNGIDALERNKTWEIVDLPADLSFTMQLLSQYMSSPSKLHMKAAMNVIKYLKKDSNNGIFFLSSGGTMLEGYLDFDWGAYADTRRSVIGYIIKMGGTPVVWKLKKQTTISHSSADVEYKALGSTVLEITWLIGLLKDLKVDSPLPILVHCDSKAVIQIASSLVFHEWTKHLKLISILFVKSFKKD
ncbi:secreted RxLR effector protein 161-like [Prosopis cineraria]|uniref:secreted RxLR effector protein 161-like n=1 Tax=Prosopis cineraria TaxID=364024 RepID=UPI00240EA5F4|nr:secreted RxLR effector protein 161-like [Prosopis cineraria]